MNKLSLIALIVLIITFINVIPSCAITIDGDYLKAKITQDLNNKYQKINPDGEVIIKTLPTVNVELKGTQLVIDSSCDFNTAGKNKLAKVILMESGKILRTIVVPIEIKAYDNVLVATKDITKGEVLNSLNTRYEKRSIATNSANIVAEGFDYSNMISQRAVKSGTIIDKRFIAKQTAISRSKPVIAIFQSGGIRLSIEVTALENGGIGDYIKVQSKEYNRIYQGRVIDSNQVLIQI